ncbi:aspartate/glutamate racemase family protein [Jannaschia sp. Os4]|nr:aspartate/glutamate racemase family protein [Jannaschia sp. Os4]
MIGILMLDTRFPRPPGDAGNPATWPFPVTIRRVPGTTPEAAVRRDPDALLDAFAAEGRALVAGGCAGLATTCGFLAPLQSRLAAACGVPVVASALTLCAPLAATVPGGRVGILTIEAASLTPAHLHAARVPEGTPVEGLDGTHMADRILCDSPDLDVARARVEMVAAARRLAARAPLGGIVLECANMGPYAADVAAATGLPVHSILTAVGWLHAGLRPSAWAHPPGVPLVTR